MGKTFNREAAPLKPNIGKTAVEGKINSLVGSQDMIDRSRKAQTNGSVAYKRAHMVKDKSK